MDTNAPATQAIAAEMLMVLRTRGKEAVALVGYLLAHGRPRDDPKSLEAELREIEASDKAYPLAKALLEGGPTGLLQTLNEGLLQDLERIASSRSGPLDGLAEIAALAEGVSEREFDMAPVEPEVGQLLAGLCPETATGPVLCLSPGTLPIAIEFARRGIGALVTAMPEWFGAIAHALSEGKVVTTPEREPLSRKVKELLGATGGAELIVGVLPVGRIGGRSPDEIDDQELETLRQAYLSLGTEGRAVLLSQGNLAGRTTPQHRETKEKLLRTGHLEGVIALPAVGSHWMSAYVLLIDRKRQGRLGGIRMVNADQEAFRAVQHGRLRRRILTGIDQIIAAYRDIATQPGLSDNVTDALLEEHRYSLEVQRYVLNNRRQEAITALSKLPTAELGEIADLIRSQMLRDADGAGGGRTVVREAAGTDIDASGQIARPERERQYGTSKPALRRLKEQQLEKGDVVLGYKGRIGAVGLMEHEPDDEIWTVNQSLMILRIKPTVLNRIPPAVLFWYLRSDLAQEWLMTHATGNNVQILSANDLRRMPIPIPTADELPTLAALIEKHFACHATIRRHQEEAAALKREFWSLG